MASNLHTDSDYALALMLQKAWELESKNGVSDKTVISPSECNAVVGKSSNSAITPASVIDPEWELLDPNPDARVLFMEFDRRYFSGKLCGVEVRWSPRMTLCAGVCCYEGRGGLCSIRLSKPLLQLRPRKDLVETLLHEMIHAYLFVTQNNRDRDGHGPEFCKHMNRINKDSGTNITIYHSFHDEVSNYRQHWWRCDGPCKSRPPYHGYVKRAMNRAPSARDPWWPDHQRTCGGTYTKVKEPEGYGVKKKKEENKASPPKKAPGTRDIRDMFEKKHSPSKSEISRSFVGAGTTGGSSDVNPTTNTPIMRRLPGIGLVRSERPSSSVGRNPDKDTVQEDAKESAIKTSTEHIPRTSTLKEKSPNTKNKRRKRVRELCLSDSEDDVDVSVKKRSFDGTEKVGQSVVVKGFRSVSGQSIAKRRAPTSFIRSDVDKVVPPILPSSEVANVACPVCHKRMPDSVINAHLDECLR